MAGRPQLATGQGRRRPDAADRTTLWSAGIVALTVPFAVMASFASMEEHCYGNGGFRVARLAVAAVVLAFGAATGVRREAGVS